ncbi:plasma kallikrein-like [Rhincodon typus]|uniref:plasma kallikrein-like n=1 Tax=Rhincodon typus TaxID=259920 RepID=UPI00202ECA27|nr:plasma kallikrein-like [Rhincodon typus]
MNKTFQYLITHLPFSPSFRFSCYLKRTTTGQPSVESDLQNVVSGYSLRHCGTQSSCFETVHDGLDFPGNDIHQSVVENEESCQRKCTEEPDCQFFTFIKEEFHNEPQRCVREEIAKGCVWTFQYLITHLPFSPSFRFSCYLKRTTTGQPSVESDLQNVVSGYSLRHCGTQSSCFETVYDGLDFPGNDIHQSVVENEESCQRKCTEEPDCQFFTFIKEEFHNEPQRYLCYRKKSVRGTPPRISILQNVISGFSFRGCAVNNSE